MNPFLWVSYWESKFYLLSEDRLSVPRKSISKIIQILSQFSRYGELYLLDSFLLKLIDVLYSKETDDEELFYTLPFPFGDQQVHNMTCGVLTTLRSENCKDIRNPITSNHNKPCSLNNKGKIQTVLSRQLIQPL